MWCGENEREEKIEKTGTSKYCRKSCRGGVKKAIEYRNECAHVWAINMYDQQKAFKVIFGDHHSTIAIPRPQKKDDIYIKYIIIWQMAFFSVFRLAKKSKDANLRAKTPELEDVVVI